MNNLTYFLRQGIANTTATDHQEIEYGNPQKKVIKTPWMN